MLGWKQHAALRYPYCLRLAQWLPEAALLGLRLFPYPIARLCCGPLISSAPDTGESKGWWKQLKVVHTPARDFADGSFGFLTTRAIEEGRRPRIIAFESRGDAQEVQWLWDSWPEAGEGSNRCV